MINNDIIDPFKNINTDQYIDLIKDYIDYLQYLQYNEYSLENDDIIFKCKRYLEYQNYFDDFNHAIKNNKDIIIKYFTFEEIFYSDNIVDFIYNSNSHKLKEKLYNIIKKNVLTKVEYVIDNLNHFTFDYLKDKYLYDDIQNILQRYKKFKKYEQNGSIIDMDILSSTSLTIDNLILKYKQCIRFDYLYFYCFFLTKNNLMDFYHKYDKYKTSIWLNNSIHYDELLNIDYVVY